MSECKSKKRDSSGIASTGGLFGPETLYRREAKDARKDLFRQKVMK